MVDRGFDSLGRSSKGSVMKDYDQFEAADGIRRGEHRTPFLIEYQPGRRCIETGEIVWIAGLTVQYEHQAMFCAQRNALMHKKRTGLDWEPIVREVTS